MCSPSYNLLPRFLSSCNSLTAKATILRSELTSSIVSLQRQIPVKCIGKTKFSKNRKSCPESNFNFSATNQIS